MTVVAPPRPPQPKLPVDPGTRDALEALIEEARRRARRRRQRRAAASVLAAGVAASAFAAFWGGGGVGSPAEPPAGASQPTPYAQAPTGLVKDGELTIIDFAKTADPNLYGAPRGWYGLSTVRRDGRLQPLVRCPGALDWCGWVVSGDWAGDGRHLAISVTTLRTPNPNGLHVVDVSTGVDHHIEQSIWLARDLDWGPGERLAYVDRGVITLINTDGTGRTTLRTGTQGRDSSPSWSPDGLWLAYATDGAFPDKARIYRIRTDGSGRQLLAKRAAAPSWSPLGTTIAYRSDCGVKLVSPAGRDFTPPSPFKCNAIGVPGTPSWSPDGTRLAIGAKPRRDFPGGTFVMNADGTNLVRLTARATGAAFAQPRPAWRPRMPRN